MWIGVIRERTQFGSMGADWYGRAKGVSKRETERVLREAFASTLPDSAFSPIPECEDTAQIEEWRKAA